ncbi:GspE/PulE family protein [Trichlorobacter ammonificans]|uniref:Type II secretion system protein E n=1 Tax=Trichlorobacter ammonificans TaxID=2916410 RepID=A0ABM9D7Z2_9BACT|nr:GspE/PulE family protein [Trichlorobacter ammonificans]CAH2031333.1 Type II secretion system protein E [Trichlorobacter ammonificans]
MAHRRIGQILVERGALTPEQLASMVAMLPVPGMRFGELCISAGLLGEVELSQALAEQNGLMWVDLGDHRIDEALLATLPADVIYRYRFIPLEYRQDCLVIAVADPTDVLRFDELEMLLGCPLLLRVASESDIASLLKAGEGTRRVLRDVTDDFMLHLVRETDKGEETLSAESLATTDTSPIIKLVNSTLLDALGRRASDIHIETGVQGVMIKYRIDGVLFQANEPIDRQFQSPVISRLKVMSELDISERRVPQDGRFKVRFRDKSIDFRISIMPSVYGEDAVIRILDKESIASEMKGLSLEYLGISPRELPRIRRKIREPYGMVLVTGPTGSGKTTTLYAALTEIHSGEEKIITIEDPVEYLVPGVLQIPVNEKKGLTFARGLRSILRHDPDTIMVGEIRDAETAMIAVQSALTGHLVFTTVHANNALDVIGRFAHMGIDPYNFVSSLNCILAQRLVRRLCRKCRRPVRPKPEELQDAGISPEQCGEAVLYEPHGCETCNGTGYLGRSAIVELLECNDMIRDLIINRATVARLKQAARQQGTIFLREAAVEKLLAGETSLREINRVTFVE